MLRLLSMFAGGNSGVSGPCLAWISTAKKSDGYHAILQKWPAQKGHTLLHEKIHHCYTRDGSIDVSVIDNLIDEIGTDVVAAMSIMVNDQGRLPVHLIADLPFDAANRDKYTKLYAKMYDLMKSYPVKALKSPVDFDLIQAAINPSGSDKKLGRNLRVIVDAVNQTRAEIDYSNTHPSYNDIAEDLKREINEGVRQLRAISNQMILSNVAKHVKQLANGNCHEYSCVLADKLMQVFSELPVEIVKVSKGDHAFVVVGRDQGSDIEKPETWGSHAIVCDAWLGDVYMANDLDKRLHTVSLIPRSTGADLRVLKSYNSRFHSLQVIFNSQDETASFRLK